MTEISEGTFPVKFASSLESQWGIGNKRRRKDEEELVAFRYAFKPASITQNTPGAYNISNGIGNNGQVVFDTNTGIQQSFDVREEHSKARECVLIFNEDTKTFTLHPFPSTLHLTLNRSSSSKAKALSITSSTSSSSKSIPLSKSNHEEVDHDIERDGIQGEHDDNEEHNTPRPTKRSRPTSTITNTNVGGTTENRQMKSGKSLPRKKPLESAPIPVLSSSSTSTTKIKGKNTKSIASASAKNTTKKGNTRKQSTAVEPDTPTKFKSSEFIEDSDEEIAASEGNHHNAHEDEEVDEFANLLGESLAQGDPYTNDDDDDDDEDEEEEESDEDEGLGGAKLVVGSSAPPVIDDDGSEWI